MVSAALAGVKEVKAENNQSAIVYGGGTLTAPSTQHTLQIN